jgi:purine-nucleoside phosphorylase
VLLTNAAGATRPDLPPGSLVAIADHINLSGTNPLLGDSSESRFVSMTDAYDEELRQALKRAALAGRVTLAEGVYMWFSGPSFETPAEVRMARLLGADLVGMSTVPEAVLARYYGLKVAAVSVVTNWAAGIAGAAPSHRETKEVAAASAGEFARLVGAFVAGLGRV